MNVTHINILVFRACELAYNTKEKYFTEFIDSNHKMMKDELKNRWH